MPQLRCVSRLPDPRDDPRAVRARERVAFPFSPGAAATNVLFAAT